METALPRCSTALLASTLILTPAALLAETTQQAVSLASSEAVQKGGGPLMRTLLDALGPDANTLTWADFDLEAGKERYSELTVGDYRFAQATLSTGGDDLIVIDLSEGRGPDNGASEVLIERVSLSSSASLLPLILGHPSLSEADLCGDGEARTSSLVKVTGLSASRPSGDDTAPGDSFSLEKATFAIDGLPRDGMCLARAEGTIEGLSLASQDVGRFTLGEMQIASFRPVMATFPETELGEKFFDYWSVADVTAAWDGIEDAVKLSFASIKADHHSDSLVPFARSGVNEFISMALEGASDSDLQEAASKREPHEMWNAFREAHGSARITIDALKVKSQALGLLPAAVLGTKGIDLLTFSGEMSAEKKGPSLDYALFQTLDPLIGMGLEAKLELGKAEPATEGTTIEQMAFYAPILLKKLDLMLDDKGVDPLLRDLTGRGLADFATDRAKDLSSEQRDLLSDWVGTAIGEGRSARLRLTPASPVPLADLPTLLADDDWGPLGALLGATAAP